MKEVYRVRCPACGMLPTVTDLKRAADERPAEVRIFVQRFGGKKKAEFMPLEGLKQGGAPGFMQYTDVTDQQQDALKFAIDFFDERIKQYQEGKK